MTPNFALSLSVDGIRFLHRVAGGWHLVGEVALDAEDMGAALAQIRQTALALEPSGIKTKVLLPNDQIKYFTLETALSDVADIETALDGATPYALDELVYDFTKDDARTFVAAVARETLAEAEAFATGFRLNPIYFAAIPDPLSFQGEPFFGTASGVSEAESQAILREAEPVKIIGHAHLPKVADFTADLETRSGVDESQPDPQDLEAPLPESELLPSFEAAQDRPKEDDPNDGEAEVFAPDAEDEPVEEIIFSSRAKPSLKIAPPVKTNIAPPEASLRTEERAEPTFASRSRSLSPSKAGMDSSQPKLSAQRGMPPAFSISPGSEVIKPSAPRRVSVSDVNPEKTRAPLNERFGAIFKFASSLWNTAKLRAKRIKIRANKSSRQKKQDAKAVNVFGARKSQGVRGKPRFLALILTALLLLFLAAVAAWASYSNDALARWIRGESAAVQFAEQTAVLPVPQISEEELSDIESAAADEVGDISAADEPLGSVPEDTNVAAQQDVSPAQGTPLSPAEAQRIYAATGVWLRAPRMAYLPRTESSDDVIIPAIDPITIGTDAIALPKAYAPDNLIFAPANPPAPDTVFPRDENGFILATPEGTLMPDGVMVYARKPNVVPPLRPALLDTNISADQAAVEAASNPLAQFRPKVRPDTLAEAIERQSLGGFTVEELASLRPRIRPGNLVPPALEPDPSVDAAVAAALENATAAAVNDASQSALSNSLRPDARPKNFETEVANAQSAPAVAIAPSSIVAPSGTTPRNVASTATQDGAINLRDMNLIGVSGTSNRRSAIVRMSNGRFVRVTVGDTLDGGQVTAIGETALNYVKNGKTYALQMP